MQRSLECCLGAIAGLAKMHAPLQASSKAHNILAFHPGKFLSSKVVHWNLARSCIAKAQLTQDKLELQELGGGTASSSLAQINSSLLVILAQFLSFQTSVKVKVLPHVLSIAAM